MFSQGHNPSRKGYSGETFYWFNPLTPEGEHTSAFPLVQRMNKILGASESLIVNAKRKAEVCVLFYPPYYATELERPVGKECELQFTASAIRRPAYFDGLLKVLQILNIDYHMADLNKASVETLASYKQVWAFSTDEMNAGPQQTLADYAKAGGNLVIFPYLPDREMSQKTCTILRDALSISPSGVETIDSPLIDVYDLKDIKCANPQSIFSEESLAGAEVIARTIRGSACGFTKALGKGTVIHMGTWIGFDTEGQKPVYEAILNQSTAKLRQATSSNYHLNVRERFTKEDSAVLFVGNYYNEEQTGQVTYTHPESGEAISIPYDKGEILWPAVYSVLTPVCLTIADKIKILHSTSDILGVAEKNGNLEITLFGDRDLQGEIVLEGEKAKNISSASISGVAVQMTRDDQRVIFTYEHRHKSEIVLCITFK
jgi:beta-galactosidase